jgi:hypothetical protein
MCHPSESRRKSKTKLMSIEYSERQGIENYANNVFCTLAVGGANPQQQDAEDA